MSLTIPEVCVLKTDGTNCDEEMKNAFEVSGAYADIVHVNELRAGTRRLSEFGILALPGGFANGDDIASGKILAVELVSHLSDSIQEFINRGKPVIGVCNGFQLLVRAGLLPNRTLGKQQVTLAENEVGRFECRWINLAVGRSVCKFFQPEDFSEQPIPMQTAHGEGRFFGSGDDIRRLKDNEQIVFRYTTPEFQDPSGYPDNPNGAVDNIAGICDPSGLILGMMPHPERSITAFHPHRIRTEAARSAANVIFSNIVSYARQA